MDLKVDDLSQKFRDVIGVSYKEPIHVKSVLRKLNILTIYKPMSEFVYGLSLKKDDYKFILVNSTCTRGRQHYAIAHELYHLYYDNNPIPHICNDKECSLEEQNADNFASSLLMPKEGLRELISQEEIDNKDIEITTIIKLEQYFSVDRLSLLKRLKQLNFLSEDQFKKVEKIPESETAKLYGVDGSLYEPGNDNVFISDFGLIVRKLFEEEKISEGHYLELMNLISDDKD